MGAEVEVAELDADVVVKEGGESLLELFGEQEVVPLHQVELAVVEFVEQHHPDEGVCDVVAAVFEVDTAIFDAHAVLDAADARLLCPHIDDASRAEARAKACGDGLLHEADLREAEISNQLFQDLRDKQLFVEIGDDEDAVVLVPLSLVCELQLDLDALFNDEEEVTVEHVATIVILLVEPTMLEWPAEAISWFRLLGNA